MAAVTPPRPTVSPILRAKNLLRNFESFVTLAETEVEMLREMARNITDRGKQIDLQEMLAAVNNTIRDNPDSAIAKLMNRFYNAYLMEEMETELNETTPNRHVVRKYEKSLSSLLFLSFGIFLLNAVNDFVRVGSSKNQARKFEDNSGRKENLEETKDDRILQMLIKTHADLEEGIFFNISDVKESEKVRNRGKVTHEMLLAYSYT